MLVLCRWLRSGLVVFDLLIVCSLLVCRGFAHRGYGFCLLWVWVLLGGDHGLLFFFFFLVLNVDGGGGGGGVKCVLQHICLDEHLKSCSTINLAS